MAAQFGQKKRDFLKSASLVGATLGADLILPAYAAEQDEKESEGKEESVTRQKI